MPDRISQFRDALALYRRHGWSLARVLMTPATLAELARAGAAAANAANAAAAQVADANAADANAADANAADANAADANVADAAAASDAAAAPPEFEGVAARESDVDAMWLRRPSAGGREAWELRLISDPPYALFELFEPDEAEEDREDVRRELEARLAEYAGGGGTEGEGETGSG